MEYIKVTANTQAEAMLKVRQTYGPEAYLYEEKWIEPDTFLGKILGKKMYQITVAVREKNKPTSTRVINSKISNLENMAARPEARNNTATRRSELSGRDELLRMMEEIKKNRLLNQESASIRAEAQNPHDIGLNKIARDIEIIKQNISARSVPLHPSDKDFFSMKSALLSQGFSGDFCEEFLTDLRINLPQSDYRNIDKIYELALSALAKRIRVNPGLGNRQVIAFIGPTGVGKTTTIAKIAADLSLKQKRKVELVTLDNFRIAATEQLKVYGNIMSVPVAICRNRDELQRTVENSTAEVILVDNTGVGSYNTKFIEEQKNFFDAIPGRVEKHLVIAATSKKEDAEEVMRKFSTIGFDRIILSKLDETNSFGAFVELSENFHRPFSYFTIGQEVPEDIHEADGLYLAKRILERWREKSTAAQAS